MRYAHTKLLYQKSPHIAFFLCLSDTAEIFIVKYNGEMLCETIPEDAEIINKKTSEFYG